MTPTSRWMLASIFCSAIYVGSSQSLVITAQKGIEFTAGIDSVFYLLAWKNSIALPLRQGMKYFFVLTKEDSAVFQKKIPSLNEIHHFVLEKKDNSQQIALYYRGLLPKVPDTVEHIKTTPAIALQKIKLTPRIKNLQDSTQLSAIHPPHPEMGPSEPDKTAALHDTLHQALNAPAYSNERSPGIDTTQSAPMEIKSAVNAFTSVIEAVKQAEFEFEKIMIIREYFTTHQTNTEELNILARLLSYDLTRLQLLKEALPYTLDKGNYKKLSSVFDFDLTKQTFENFMRENEQQ